MKNPGSEELPVPKGFFERHTGGGCMAWEMNHADEDDFEIWITDLDGSSMPDQETEYIIIGFHLLSTQMHFKEGEPPIIPELLELTKDEHDLFDVNGDYFSYGVDVSVHDLDAVIEIVRQIPNNTFNSKVVLGLNNPDKEMSQ